MEQAEIRTVIEIITAELDYWIKLGEVEAYCSGFEVYWHEDCIRRVLQEMTSEGKIQRRTHQGNFEYRKNNGTPAGEMVDGSKI